MAHERTDRATATDERITPTATIRSHRPRITGRGPLMLFTWLLHLRCSAAVIEARVSVETELAQPAFPAAAFPTGAATTAGPVAFGTNV